MLRDIIGQNLDENVNTIIQKEVNMVGLDELERRFVQNCFYNDVPSFEEVDEREPPSLSQKIAILSQLDKIGGEI